VPLVVKEALADFDVLWVGHDLPSDTDLTIYQQAVKDDRILVTLDRDFVQLRLFQKSKPMIILLRFQKQQPVKMAERLEELIAQPVVKLKKKLLVLSEDDVLVYE
jgi:predicted nuclease of predicted toxin-antitoxin system